MRARFTDIVFYIFIAWIFISAHYYIENYITGDFNQLNSTQLTRFIKYLIIIFISILIGLSQKLNFFIKTNFIVLLLISFFYIFVNNYLDNINLFERNLTNELLLFNMLCFLTFINIIPTLEDFKLAKLINFLILTSTTVAFFGYYEIFFLNAERSYYWETYEYRISSVLLNPNNLGFYLGAVTLLLIFKYSESLFNYLVILFIIPIFFLTFSRGAIFSLLSTLMISQFLKKTKLNLFYTFILFSISIIFIFLYYYDINIRYFNLSSAFEGRLERLYIYSINFNFNYLLPDFSNERSALFHENSFLLTLNCFGLLIGLLFIIINLSYLKLSPGLEIKNMTKNEYSFLLVSIYYCIGSLVDNILLSFPNNQLFIVSLGIFLKIKKK
jgi:hypothetical protein